MMDIKEVDKELYYQRYIKKDYDKLNELWNEVKDNKELLEEAIKVTKDKFGEDTLQSLVICECMLITYDKVDNEIYQKDIEKNFVVRRSTASGIIDTMEKNGMLKRQDSTLDLRTKRIVLTDKYIDRMEFLESLIEKFQNDLQ